MGGVGGSGGEPDAMELAEVLHLSIEELCPPVRHQILGSTVVLYPVQDEMLCNGGALLVFDKDGGLEPREGVHHVEDVWGSITVPSVLLEINGKDMVKI